jgi:hypothetical protein
MTDYRMPKEYLDWRKRRMLGQAPAKEQKEKISSDADAIKQMMEKSGLTLEEATRHQMEYVQKMADLKKAIEDAERHHNDVEMKRLQVLRGMEIYKQRNRMGLGNPKHFPMGDQSEVYGTGAS